MKGPLIATLAFGVATLVSGCGDGGGGPASPAFDPFGSEPSGASSEPSGASGESPPTPQSIADLCVTVCARFEAACPSSTATNCAGSCTADATQYPACVSELQSFLICAGTAPITCPSSATVGLEACASSEIAFEDCLHGLQPVAGPSS